MQVYSKKIVRFIEEIKHAVKTILAKEIGLKVYGDRFYDRKRQFSYPIKIVIFESNKKLGYFESDFYELGFNVVLMQKSTLQLHNIIRHELAHYITFIQHGTGLLPHGPEFKTFCRQMNWSEQVYAATTCLDDDIKIDEIKEDSILRKVQKLMALSKSCNEHEAELAMIKSQQLLLKHNIDVFSFEKNDDDKIYLKRILTQTKKDAKMRSIALILETFFVNIVYSSHKGFTCLEITGNATNIEIADYVAGFLDLELDRLWIQAKKQHGELKGAIAKNSFFLGIAQGYCNKIKFLKKDYQKDVANGLMVIEKQLIEAKNLIYPRLSKTTSRASYCPDASALGFTLGSNLKITPGVANSTNQGKAISYLC